MKSILQYKQKTDLTFFKSSFTLDTNMNLNFLLINISKATDSLKLSSQA